MGHHPKAPENELGPYTYLPADLIINCLNLLIADGVHPFAMNPISRIALRRTLGFFVTSTFHLGIPMPSGRRRKLDHPQTASLPVSWGLLWLANARQVSTICRTNVSLHACPQSAIPVNAQGADALMPHDVRLGLWAFARSLEDRAHLMPETLQCRNLFAPRP